MKEDFYIYKCLKEIHRRKQAELLEKHQKGFLLILNTPGSLEYTMIHTDPEALQTIFNRLLDHVTRYIDMGSIEFGFKPDGDEHFSFYVSEPIGTSHNHSGFDQIAEKETDLISELTEIISGLGGLLWVERKPFAARTFWFTLEIQPPGVRGMDEIDNPVTRPHPDWSKRSILIVDDVPSNLLLLEGFLIPTKARVISVNNGLKAVNAVKKDERIDFVLMDVRMPVLDGYEATRRIKRIQPWLPVVALSAYPSSAETENWKKAGCDAFLGKPLNINDLFNTMSVLFEKMPMP